MSRSLRLLLLLLLRLLLLSLRLLLLLSLSLRSCVSFEARCEAADRDALVDERRRHFDIELVGESLRQVDELHGADSEVGDRLVDVSFKFRQ